MAPQKSPPKKPSTSKMNAQPSPYRSHPPRPPAGPPEIVDPVWLLKAVGVVIAAALICGYCSLCFLLYQGQWQLILHPKQTSSSPAATSGMPLESMRFGTDESGVPQLTGWVIPAMPGARYADYTLLFLPSGDGSLADSFQTLVLLHEIGINVFAIDYRGYGQSVSVHPNQARMTQDVDSAFQYLTASRAIAEHLVIPFGSGVGASLAAHLSAEHAGIPAVILDSPGPDPLETILRDPRTRFLPVRALIHDRFPLAGPLGSLKTPKLLLQTEKDDQAFRGAADPKITVFAMPIPSSKDYASMLTRYVTRFLDQYVAKGTIQQLHPN
jgi:pimeloyl-ACP methyl ester carboxylesterase